MCIVKNYFAILTISTEKMNHSQLDECQKEKKDVISIIYYLYDLVCWKIFYIWIKSILGNYEITLYSYFLPGDIDRYGYRWTDVHCFSIVDCRWHYSIGDVTLIMDQEEKTEWDMILKKKKEKQQKLGVGL